MARTPLWSIAIIGALSACRPSPKQEVRGPDRGLVIAQPFPDEQRLEQLAARPAPPEEQQARVIGVDAWRLQGPLPTATSSTPATDPDATALAGIVGGGERRVTQQLGCFSREAAAFVLQHDAQPSADLTAWIGARCGVGHAHPAVLLVKRGPIAQVKLDAATDGAAIRGVLGQLPGAHDIGIGLADDGKLGALVLAAVRRRVVVDSLAMTVDAGRIVVSGESAAPIGWVLGYATLGDDRFSVCDPVASKRSGPQAFALSCAVDPEDAEASIEIAVAQQGAVLGEMVLALWVSPSGALGSDWTARRIPVPVDGADRGPLAWLTAINAIRERAKLPAWTHAKGQSELVGGLLPHMVGLAVDPRLRDEIALGMLAGWKVDGTIRDGDLRLSVLPSDVPFDRAVGAAMSSPTFRAGVLARDTATAAIAVHEVRAANLSQIAIVGYSLFGNRDYTAEEERFLDMLDADRMSRGLPAVERVGGPKDRALLDAAAARVRSGESGPSDELDALLDHFSQATGQTMRGGLYTTLTLDGYRPTFEGPIAVADRIVVMAKIADWRPAGAAWGQHVIYVIFAVPGEHAS